ncbi:Sulfotransferase family cytosolic 1B member 1, partial [Armadillidium nasatum]
MLASTTGAPPLSPSSEAVRKFKMLYPGKQISDGILLHLTSLNKPPRLIKAYLPPCFFPTALPDMCKVIYIVREPLDVLKNLYLRMRLNVLYEYRGKREDYVDYFINDKMCFGPYWKHVKLGWNKRMHPNFLFLFYEDLKENLEDEVRKIDGFLGTRRTDAQITNVTLHSFFFGLPVLVCARVYVCE